MTETPAAQHHTKLSFNPDNYRAFVQDMDLSVSQQDELLRAVWTVIVGVIDLKCGMHLAEGNDPVTKALEADSASVVNFLSNSETTNEEDATARDGPDARGMDS